MKRKQILENVCMQSLMWGIVMNVFCLLIYKHLLVFFLLAGKKYVYNPADDSPPDTLVFLPLLPLHGCRGIVVTEFDFFVFINVILVLVRVRHYAVFFLVRSHQLFFHNVEVDHIEFLKGTKAVSELEVEICKLFEVRALENVVGSRHCWRASVCDAILETLFVSHSSPIPVPQ